MGCEVSKGGITFKQHVSLNAPKFLTGRCYVNSQYTVISFENVDVLANFVSLTWKLDKPILLYCPRSNRFSKETVAISVCTFS